MAKLNAMERVTELVKFGAQKKPLVSHDAVTAPMHLLVSVCVCSNPMICSSGDHLGGIIVNH